MVRKKKIVAIEEFDLELCGVWLRKYDQLIQGWLENDTHTLSKSYLLKRFFNQILDIYLREENNVIDLSHNDAIKLLKKYRKEEFLEENVELTESELEGFEEVFIPWKGFTLQDLEEKIDSIRKTSYSRRLKEYNKGGL